MVKILLPFLVAVSLFRIIPHKANAQTEYAIHEVQGSANESPVTGELISLKGNIVTARGNSFFVIQAPETLHDNSDQTSEAIIIDQSFFGSPGDVVDITGTVYEENGLTILSQPGLTITNTGQDLPLPPPIELTAAMLGTSYSLVHSLEAVEGMRVSFQATANGPSTSSEDIPLRLGGQRVFREPGILAPGIDGLPEWDGNPELFWMDPNGLSAPNNRFVETGSQVEATGIMIEADSRFWMVLPETYSITPGTPAQPVRPKAENEFTVGSLNTLFLLEDEPDIETRYEKVARYIDEQMQLPDILAIQEVGSLSALNNLAFFLEQQNPEARYDAYLIPTNLTLKLGYLIKEEFSNIQVTALGAEEIFTFTGGLLHDRPPLLLQIQLPTDPVVNLQVLNLHLRSLNGIEGSSSGFVRNKRHQQAISVAQMVDDLQEEGNLVVLGDFNAFQFSDGYVDVFNQIAGLPSLGAQFSPLDLVDPPLTNQLNSLDEEDRYSFVFRGSAQVLDHCLTSSFNGLTVNGMEYARGNADFPRGFELNTSNALRASDHDGLVLYLQSDFPISTLDISKSQSIRLTGANPVQPGGQLQIISGQPLIHAQLYSTSGQLLMQKALQGTQSSCSVPEYPSGMYVLKVRSEETIESFRIILQ